MDKTEDYIINLKDLQVAGSTYEYVIGDPFFEHMDGVISHGSVHSVVACEYSGGLFKLSIRSKGIVVVPCDRCLADMDLHVDTVDTLVAKLGQEYSDDGDCVTVALNDGGFDLSPFIYNFILLSLPVRCVHEEEDMCDQNMIIQLRKYQIGIEKYED